MAKKYSFQIKANVKQGFGKEALIEDLLALTVPFWYTLAPTLLGLEGAVGMLVGAGVPYAVAKMLNAPSVGHAALGIAGQHLMYSYAGGSVEKFVGKPIWRFSDSVNGFQNNTTVSANPLPVSVQGLSDAQYIQSGGEVLQAYNPNEIDAQAHYVQEPMSTTGINDIIDVASGRSTMLSDGGLSWGSSRQRKSW